MKVHRHNSSGKTFLPCLAPPWLVQKQIHFLHVACSALESWARLGAKPFLVADRPLTSLNGFLS